MRGSRLALLAAGGLAAALVVVVLVARADRGTGRAASERPCRARVDRGVLPAWARTGFSDPRPRAPHVLGRQGRIAAILFEDPLRSPPAQDRGNKILWVARAIPPARSDLRISARRMSGTRPIGAPVARRVAGAPGPSLIDLPAAGCWRLTLHWSGRSDSLDLRYA